MVLKGRPQGPLRPGPATGRGGLVWMAVAAAVGLAFSQTHPLAGEGPLPSLLGALLGLLPLQLATLLWVLPRRR